jgi:hypothetical protein
MLTKAPEQFLSNFDVAGGLQCQKCLSSCSILRASGNFWLSSRTWKDALTWFRTDMDRLKIFENVWNCLGCERNGTELKNNKDTRRFFVHVVTCFHGQGMARDGPYGAGMPWSLWTQMNPIRMCAQSSSWRWLAVLSDLSDSKWFKMIRWFKIFQDISRYFKMIQVWPQIWICLVNCHMGLSWFVMVCYCMLLFFTFLHIFTQEISRRIETAEACWRSLGSATQCNTA